MLGSRPQAESAQLIFLAGGEARRSDETDTGLGEQWGRRFFQAGPLGTGGMAMKLAINTLFGVQVAVMAELWGLLRNAGVTLSLRCPS